MHQEPRVAKAETLEINEFERVQLKKLIGSRTSNASRVKSLADSLLYRKYGSSGSSNRLFKRCRECS